MPYFLSVNEYVEYLKEHIAYLYTYFAENEILNHSWMQYLR